MNFISLANKSAEKSLHHLHQIPPQPKKKNMPPNSPNAWADFDFADDADVLVTAVTVLAAALACALAKGDFWGSCADVQTLSSRLRLRNKASPRPRFSMATLICRHFRIFKISKIYSKMDTMRTIWCCFRPLRNMLSHANLRGIYGIASHGAWKSKMLLVFCRCKTHSTPFPFQHGSVDVYRCYTSSIIYKIIKALPPGVSLHGSYPTICLVATMPLDLERERERGRAGPE